MARTGMTYPVAALAVVLSLPLWTVMPDLCHAGPEDALPGHGRDAMPCTGPCHVARSPDAAATQVGLVGRTIDAGVISTRVGSGAAALQASASAVRVTSGIAISPPDRRRSPKRSARLHVLYGLFLN